MFVVERVARGHSYLYLVESVRVGKSVRQRTIKPLGRKDVLAASGELDRLVGSIARHAERSIILSDIDAGRIAAHRIDGGLGRQRLSLADKREMAGIKDVGQPHSPAQAGRQVDAAQYRAGQCREIVDPCP